ncbi:MAG: hypothetical protein WA446_02810 [Steroidobacteraceae bacterium]
MKTTDLSFAGIVLAGALHSHPQISLDPLLDVDSTQTLRALTPIELGEDQLSKWSVIQLAVADTAFHPQDVLNLDIFNEFSLYSTIGLDQGRVLHALRLGFFRTAPATRPGTGSVYNCMI